MAEITQIAVRIDYLKSLKQYENVRLGAEVVMTKEETEDYKEVYDKAWDIVGKQISNQLKLFK